MWSRKKEAIYLSFLRTNMPSWFWCLHDLDLLVRNTLLRSSVFVSEPPLNHRKIKWGWSCLQKETEAKLSMQYIKSNLRQWKEVVVFIFQIKVVPRTAITIYGASKRSKFQRKLSPKFLTNHEILQMTIV